MTLWCGRRLSWLARKCWRQTENDHYVLAKHNHYDNQSRDSLYLDYFHSMAILAFGERIAKHISSNRCDIALYACHSLLGPCGGARLGRRSGNNGTYGMSRRVCLLRSWQTECISTGRTWFQSRRPYQRGICRDKDYNQSYRSSNPILYAAFCLADELT
jgi:hypothetical protein